MTMKNSIIKSSSLKDILPDLQPLPENYQERARKILAVHVASYPGQIIFEEEDKPEKIQFLLDYMDSNYNALIADRNFRLAVWNELYSRLEKLRDAST